MKKIIIIGGGLTGLSAAYFLEKENISYTLIEKENTTGGLCKTLSVNGYKFDYTGHLLHLRSENIKNILFDELNLKKLLSRHKRMSKILISNRFVDYPFQANINQLPEKIKNECIEGFKRRISNIDVVSFKDWVKKYFGDGMGKYFFYPYNEKLWRMKCDKLSYEWTGRYVPQVSLNDIENPPDQIGYNSYFYYPRNSGIDILPQTIENKLNSINMIKGEKVLSINYQNKTIKTEKETFKYDILINTSPLNKFLDMCSIENDLKVLSVFNLNIGFNKTTDDSIHWIYFPEEKFSFYRSGFYSHFNSNMAPAGKDSIYVEISYKGDSIKLKNGILERDEIENNLFIRSILNQLKDAGIANGEIDLVHVNKIKPAYVIYDFYRKNNLDKFLKQLEENEIYSIGRYGSWIYNSMEDNILQAWETVEKIKKLHL